MKPQNDFRFESRAVGYFLLCALLSLVSDGWAGKPSPLIHQILLLPAAVAFLLLLVGLLRHQQSKPKFPPILETVLGPRGLGVSVAAFALWSLLFILLENWHFRALGYHLTARGILPAALIVSLAGVVSWKRRSSFTFLLWTLATYTAAMWLAISCFPLNYLRSDMLPVITWADARIVHHLNPYGTMHVGIRTYDFPYLPGMLVAFLPAATLGIDVRWLTLAYTLASAGLIYWMTRSDRRWHATMLLAFFLLCPFLEYRHDLYLQPHWFSIVLAVVLCQRRQFAWAALVWGVSCGIYQLSWVIVPFTVLYAFRRAGVLEALKTAVLIVFGALTICGPFLLSAAHKIASNTVGQWSRLPHALADPINLSYWLTYLIRPDQLKYVQATILTVLFLYCCFKRRCQTLADTLRWMCIALAVFIPLNVLVDGYFYLTLLLLLLLYLCAEQRLWADPAPNQPVHNLRV